MNVIEVKNLRKSFGRKEALKGISFSVAEGEIFGLLGPNGAGKTTTLEILEGLKDSDSGAVQVLPRSKVGVVLQNSGFLPELTVRELLELFASFYEKTLPLDQTILDFGLENIQRQAFGSLSGGQKQRVALATALLHEPKVIFLDEPTLGLDPSVRQKFWETIIGLRKKGLSILLTTHYMEEAEIVCDRVAIIDEGRIVAQDRPVRLINSLGVISHINFMSSKPINVAHLENLKGILVARRDRYTYELETETPEISLRELLEWEKIFDGKIFNLQVQQGTLEDVFLKLTGHRLQE